MKVGAVVRELGYTAYTSDKMQRFFSAKADGALDDAANVAAAAQAALASGKDPELMSKNELDALLKVNGVKPGTTKATSYDLYINHVRAQPQWDAPLCRTSDNFF